MPCVFRPSSLLRLLLGAALSVLISSAAWAQGMYYKEIAKDGRIYVFNIAANAERFEKSGEMGIGITKPGVGPNGETVIGDNERALQLYFFKHGIAEAVPEPPPPTQTIVWRDGKTRITTDNAYLEISNRVQVRFTEEFPDDNTQLPGTGARGRFARLVADPPRQVQARRLDGAAVVDLRGPTELAGDHRRQRRRRCSRMRCSTSTSRKGKGLFRVHVGQFKVPCGAQQTDLVRQPDVRRPCPRQRCASSAAARPAPRCGARHPNNKFEWRFGMSNGNGLTRTLNDNDKFQYNARLMWQPNGSQVLNQRAWVTGALYSESDFESTTSAIYAVAINWENQNNFNARPAIDQKWNAYALDGIYKFHGFSANGMYTLANQRRPETGAKFDSQGGFIQAGQLFSRRRFEVAGPLWRTSIQPTSRRGTTPRRLAACSTTTTRGMA